MRWFRFQAKMEALTCGPVARCGLSVRFAATLPGAICFVARYGDSAAALFRFDPKVIESVR